jgi:hypothetical protein
MKTRLFLLASAALVSPSLANEVPRFERSTVMRDAVTHDALAQKLRMAAHHDPIRNLGPAIGKTDEDPAKRVNDRDLIKESTVLHYRGFLTLVPKRAVVHMPANLEDRMKIGEKVQVQSWADFFKGNRGWIRTLEVTRDQAMGLAPLDEATVTALRESTQVVVATFKGGPISVMPYVAPEPETAEGTASPETDPSKGTLQGNTAPTKTSLQP